MKLIDLLKNKGREPTFSLEFYPPKTAKGIEMLKSRITKFGQLNPLFIDLTWGSGGSTSDLTLQLATEWTKDFNVNMHITCTNMSIEKINQSLATAKANGICNLVALRGDPPKTQNAVESNAVESSEFKSGLDLINHIKKVQPDSFCLTVSGYPEGHPDQIEKVPSFAEGSGTTSGSEVGSDVVLSETEKLRLSIKKSENGLEYYVCRDSKYMNELIYLKKKIDAGGELIITQLFYDCDLYIQFVKDCRQIGINCPILPGIMLIQSYAGFVNMTNLCRTKVPEWLYNDLTMIKDNPERIIDYSVNLAKKMIGQLYENGVDHFHLYTLNQESVTMEVIDYIIHMNCKS